MDQGESLGIYLQTIRTLMNSRIYQQQESQNKSELDILEEQDFLSQLLESLVDLQEKLKRDRQEKEEEYEKEKERQQEQINCFQQEIEIFEQQNQELEKLIQNEEEQHIQMTQQLAKSQLQNFQSSQILQELDNEFYESNKFKIKTDEINFQNKLMKEKKLQLLNEEKMIKSQIEDQQSLIKKLQKEHLQIEAQYRMFEDKLNKMRKDQETSMTENQKQKQNIQQIQQQCRQLLEQNQALMSQRESIQYQIEEALSDHNIIMPLGHLQQNGIPLPFSSDHHENGMHHQHISKNTSAHYEQVGVTSLKDEIGDQFSENFFSPISSVTETDREEIINNGYHKNNKYASNIHPFILEDKNQNNYYESSGNTTEQSSTKTRSSEHPSSTQTVLLENPIKNMNKVMLASDFGNQYQYDGLKSSSYQDEIIESSKLNHTPQEFNFQGCGGFIGNQIFNNKNNQNQQNPSGPKQLNNQEIQQICTNIISWLTYKPLIQLKKNQILNQ
ncbi:hypothetical protein TTHERM_00389820 (macronuclear) [Tetrahymena thermophila SB210]|uniref:Uncharacterized protein n=1 Tax=Tetrahymena thermophila (strain SB210) TaxID=312017 RepID=Q23RA6_TETTS|nr:hypothetical protein TTHERM_00389820 [Tetrahymena thermophila SB210]EAR99142.1 hypothetical protein TTHERM_00389820 [Tetrahymena thermophila SB210]|eukprot:XP_001019387.1 hypothetical protein TTHERM_00389820 [Tetrahymena thermophila SB210]